MKKYLFLCCLANSVFAAPDLTAIPYAYSPLTAAEWGQPFAVQWVGEIDHFQPPKALSVKAGHALGQFTWQAETASQSELPLTLAGKDRAGKPWHITLAAMRGCAPTRVYHADLDRNGLEDVILARSTCGNGLAMPTTLYIITFEENGRPILLMLNSYFDDEERQISALRDLNQDGKAELCDMSFSKGYWASSVYQLHAARWQQVQGAFASHHYPLFTRFTHQANHKPAALPKAQWVRDFSNARPSKTGQLSVLSPQLEDEQLTSVRIVLNTPAKQNCALTDAWIITQDTATGRSITTEAAALATHSQLAKRVKSGKLQAQLFGQTSVQGCSPAALWLAE